jgi:hypothetical protein
MTASPNYASDSVAGMAVAAAAAANVGPFVLNLCSSSTPMALAQTELPELKRFTFFVSRRFEEGRERFRLHMGYFATLAEAEEWLHVVREIYPGAWAGESPGRKLRERATAAQAAQAQHAAGPPPLTAAISARPAAAPPRVAVPPNLHVPVVHPAPPQPQRAAPVSRAAPAVARAASPLAPSRPSPTQAHIPAVPASPARPPLTQARTAVAAPPPPRPQPVASAAVRTPPPPRPQPLAAAAVRAPLPPQAPPAARALPPAVAKAPLQPQLAAKLVSPPAAPATAMPRMSKANAKPVFEDSNVREVLKALGDASATGETRQMQAPVLPREATGEHAGLSDTQVLRLLEARRAGAGEAGTAEALDGNIPLLKPDDTGTRRALKEAVVNNSAVAFAVQLQWSVQPVELDKVPPLAIFSAYTLYTVEGSRDGRKWYGLRLGFFSDAISAKQVAHYVRSEFASVAVLPVSPQEKARATDQELAATLSAPTSTRSDPMDEFKLIDEASVRPATPAAPAKVPGRKLAVGRALREIGPQPKPAPKRGGGKVWAGDRRNPHTLEETLEILGASQLSIDIGTGETLNDSGVRHLQVETQKNSPFAKLLERLSERLRKP